MRLVGKLGVLIKSGAMEVERGIGASRWGGGNRKSQWGWGSAVGGTSPGAGMLEWAFPFMMRAGATKRETFQKPSGRQNKNQDMLRVGEDGWENCSIRKGGGGVKRR